ncbi:MAG: PHP domain-containing protein [Firmicutes bacterium]|nr:PHP domain-containing protein [Bacillota bacterium]
MNVTSKKADLHLHSSCSDGAYTPSQLVQILAAAGLKAFSLTDHDTTKGLSEAAKAAEESGLEFVPGIEISVVEESREIHILGFYPVKLLMLEEKLADLSHQRFMRMEKTVRLLQKSGFKINEAEVIAEAGQAAPGRMHLARMLLRKGYVHSVEEAFKLYLGFKRPAYVQRKTFSLIETIKLLVDCLAIPVLAHPGEEGLAIAKTLIPDGLMGIEAFHPDHSNSLIRKALSLASEQQLLVTGGSDFHGSPDSGTFYPIERAIDYGYLKQLKEKKKL